MERNGTWIGKTRPEQTTGWVSLRPIQQKFIYFLPKISTQIDPSN
jgi:hypothetical protein